MLSMSLDVQPTEEKNRPIIDVSKSKLNPQAKEFIPSANYYNPTLEATYFMPEDIAHHQGSSTSDMYSTVPSSYAYNYKSKLNPDAKEFCSYYGMYPIIYNPYLDYYRRLYYCDSGRF